MSVVCRKLFHNFVTSLGRNTKDSHMKVFSHCPLLKMWKFSITMGRYEQHSFLFRLWQGILISIGMHLPHIYSSVGYCIVIIVRVFPQPSVRYTKSAPHFSFYYFSISLELGGLNNKILWQ